MLAWLHACQYGQQMCQIGQGRGRESVVKAFTPFCHKTDEMPDETILFYDAMKPALVLSKAVIITKFRFFMTVLLQEKKN